MNDLEKSKTEKTIENETDPQSSTFIEKSGDSPEFLENIAPIEEVKSPEGDEKPGRYDFLYKDIEKDPNDSQNESTNTSYQDLPSIQRSKSPSKMEDMEKTMERSIERTIEKCPEATKHTTNNNTLQNISSIETKPNYSSEMPKYSLFKSPVPNNVKPINLNTSIQSLTSQCTIDSLAKRVQKLVGPVDYKSSSLGYSGYKPGMSSSAVAEVGKHSLINYDSIYKELDSIQHTLRSQNSFNKHLENLASVNATDKYETTKTDTYLDKNQENKTE